MTKDKGGGEPSEAGFVSRWSQRKQAAKAPPLPVDHTAAAPAVEPPDGRPDEEVLADLGLPDPDRMSRGDDFSAFMTKAVPARLRNRALRRLWQSDPAYATIDALVDYADDYTDAATVVQNLKTAYQVGKGFADQLVNLDHAAADAPESPENQAEAVDENDPEAGLGRLAEQGEAPECGVPFAELSPYDDAGEIGPPDDSAPVAAPRRRMRFRLA